MNVHEFYKDAKGETVQALGWGTVKAQNERFYVISQYANSGTSVLDVGCGFGDYTKYLTRLHSYCGIDVRESAIKTAREKYPDHSFMTREVFEMEDKYDWVIASGIFCFDCDVEKTLKKMFSLCKQGVAVNFLYGNQDLRSFTVSEINEFGKQLTDRYVIRRDYLPNDTTLILYK